MASFDIFIKANVIILPQNAVFFSSYATLDAIGELKRQITATIMFYNFKNYVRKDHPPSKMASTIQKFRNCESFKNFQQLFINFLSPK